MSGSNKETQTDTETQAKTLLPWLVGINESGRRKFAHSNRNKAETWNIFSILISTLLMLLCLNNFRSA